MKNKNLNRGFIPFLVIAVVAVLAIGGGTYVVTKKKEVKVNTEVEDDINTQANMNADINANSNANLGVNENAKGSGSLRSLVKVGKNVMCTFSSTAPGVSSSGTVYISTDGSMRGDFSSQTSAGTQTSSMIVKGETSHVWSGSQGMKINVSEKETTTSSEVSTNKSVDLDSQVDYKCIDWPKDESKFIVPASVKFLDVGAMMKGSTVPGGVDVEGMIKLKAQ